MEEQNLDAESISRNKKYGPKDHLKHLLKVGWDTNSPLVKKFARENGMNINDIKAAAAELNSKT